MPAAGAQAGGRPAGRAEYPVRGRGRLRGDQARVAVHQHTAVQGPGGEFLRPLSTTRIRWLLEHTAASTRGSFHTALEGT